jgi:hypothetical protein
MSVFNKFNSFTEAVAEKVHNLGSDQLVVALTNTLPTAGNTQLSNITQISYTYCSSRNLTRTSSSQTGGVYSLILSDLTLTASGGAIGPFRYVVIYNDTATNDELIGWYDAGSAITVPDTGTVLLDLSQVTGLLSIT